MTNSTNTSGTHNNPETSSSAPQEGRENVRGSHSNAFARVVNGTEEIRLEMSDILDFGLGEAGHILRLKRELTPEAQDRLVHIVVTAQNGEAWAAEALKSDREFTVSQKISLVDKIAASSKTNLVVEVLEVCHGLTELQQEQLVQNLVRNNSNFSAGYLLSCGRVFPERLQTVLVQVIHRNSAHAHASHVLTSAGATLTPTQQALLIESIPLAPDSYISARRVLLHRDRLTEHERDVLIDEIVFAKKPEIAEEILDAVHLQCKLTDSQRRKLGRVAEQNELES